VVLVPAYGTIGAAWSLLAASTVRLVCVIIGYRYIIRQQVPRFIMTRGDLARVLPH